MKKIFIIMSLLISLSMVSCGMQTEKEKEVIVDTTQFSRISSKELIEKLGEPTSSEDWTNKTTKGDYLVTTYEYNTDDIHYEFVLADDTVVRLSLYSSLYWNSDGDYFRYKKRDKSDILSLFGIDKTNDYTKVVTNNNTTYKVSPISDTIASFDAQSIDSKDKTIGLVKVTYNTKYFD